MITPEQDAERVRTATEQLLHALMKLDSAEVTQPSQLPGWTRAHVLAHLARNADALVNVLAGQPMYRSAEARDADIERGAGSTLAELLDDVRRTASRLDTAFHGLTEEDWKRTVTLRNGVTDLASALPFRRWVEVELHHVDLGIGYTLEDLPGTFLDRELTTLARRFASHPDVPEAIELRAEDGRVWHTGAEPREGEPPLVVAGSPSALVGWLAGRTSGTGLSARGSLPKLPPL
ncbi:MULTISPECIES: maleylpyruvate isomerase family mycothiol-dependent enzyme [Streptomyces]|uniref:maleylpyruvate isomerase family mycothiol-dependent enzyme n=1 Tax=Streptomyces TaxID=1883 RepID=UPI0011F2DCD0|nr:MULTISPECIES: maleylpyruvate isomerase family mycothiol-dependent enzyme [Streptomyces]QHF94070.1 mycothiol maleylpyruvate isomerase [Streptomyces sp. NHF165]